MATTTTSPVGSMEFLVSASQTLSPDQPQRPKFRRAPVACRRCRRLRVKCRHVDAHPPCELCQQSGHECVFPQRGEPDFDRAYRNERKRKQQIPARQDSTESTLQTPIASANSTPPRTSNGTIEPQNQGGGIMSLTTFEMPNSGHSTTAQRIDWDLLPPYEEVVEGCQVFITSYFQLGFLPKASFFERLQRKKEDVSVFLLLSILSISARFTPSLVRRYGDGQNATNYFLETAAAIVLEHMYKPSLEAIQAFFLISLAEWGKGDKDRSSTHMGIAVRMAGTFRLHREEAYYLPENASAEEVVESEVARRTFWMLENHDNLHSGFNSPVSFSLSDITTLLPCEEQDFAFGIAPAERAALMGTTPALKDDQLTKAPSRSLFATLIQTHNLWGQIARRVARNEVDQQYSTLPGIDKILSDNEYIQLSSVLKEFEEHLPQRHRWSVWNLRGFRAEGLDLAYLSVVMMIRLSNIILRRSYVSAPPEGITTSRSSLSDRGTIITEELFSNMVVLHEQIEAFFSLRSPDQGFPVFVVFCIYICGSLANHLQTGERHVVDSPSRAMSILERSAKLLGDIQDAWPMAKRWSDALMKAYKRQRSASSIHASRPRAPTAAAASARQTEANEHFNSSHYHHTSSPNGILPPTTMSMTHADQTPLFTPPEHRTPDVSLDGMSQSNDPWNERFPGMPLTDNCDIDLAFYLWPGGDLWGT